jgi:hypothetical protein
MSFFIITSKFMILLKKFDDWDEWFLIVKFMIKSDDIKKYVNLTETFESLKSSKSKLSSFFDIVQEITSTANLIENQRRDLSMMRDDVKKEIRAYRERKKTLRVLNIHILISVDRINFLYLTDEDTVFKKLLVLKKRLTFIDRIRELEIIRKFHNLQNRVLKNQQINQWLLKCEKIYVETTRLKIKRSRIEIIIRLSESSSIDRRRLCDRSRSSSRKQDSKKWDIVNKRSLEKFSKSHSNNKSSFIQRICTLSFDVRNSSERNVKRRHCQWIESATTLENVLS